METGKSRKCIAKPQDLPKRAEIVIPPSLTEWGYREILIGPARFPEKTEDTPPRRQNS